MNGRARIYTFTRSAFAFSLISFVIFFRGLSYGLALDDELLSSPRSFIDMILRGCEYIFQKKMEGLNIF